ncbi:hypothetical protein DPSP01_001238 [Paraphaeosphaeria sporulosa]
MKLFTAVELCITVLRSVLAFMPGPNNTPFDSTSVLNDGASDHSPNLSRSKHLDHQLGLSSGGPTGNTRPWPRRIGLREVAKGDASTIPYCFFNKRSYDELLGPVKEVIGLWQDALGDFKCGKAGPENRHSLAFKTLPRGNPKIPNPYCCDGYNYSEEGNELDLRRDLRCVSWNYEYNIDRLAIHWVDEVKKGGDIVATVSYTDGTREGRHTLFISKGNNRLPDIAHELGHVFSLAYEFSRWDRDEYILFNCNNLRGMQETVDGVLDALNHSLSGEEVWQNLCTESDCARNWVALSFGFTKGDKLEDGADLDAPDGFDMNPIMMCSFAAGAPIKDVTKGTAVSVKLKKNSNGQKYVDPDDWEFPTHIVYH